MPKSPRVAIKLDLRWPYKRHAHIFAGTQQYADEHGWESLIDEYADEHLANASPESLPFDGVIGRVNSKLADGCRRLGVPLVNVWFNSSAKHDLPGVFPDMAAVGRVQAEHLLSRGLRRFAVLTCEDDAQKLVAASFRATIAAANGECVQTKLPLDPCRTFAAWQRTERRIEAWMEDWQLPIGVSIASEEAGRIVIQICRRRGWRVPGDVAIIAGSNEEVLCNHPRPSLTSVEFGYERIGYEAARLLDELMKSRSKRRGPRNQSPKQVLLPPQGLIVRESTDFYAVNDEVVTQDCDSSPRTATSPSTLTTSRKRWPCIHAHCNVVSAKWWTGRSPTRFGECASSERNANSLKRNAAWPRSRVMSASATA